MTTPTRSNDPAPLRYVVLRHEGIPDPHYDLMFETFPGGELMTWRSHQWPVPRPTPVERIKDHRNTFLDYEGPLTDDRGFVRRIERGACRLALHSEEGWIFHLPERTPPLRLQASRTPDGWLLTMRA